MNLFVAPPTIDPAEYGVTKTAGIKLTSSPGYWDDEIAQTLLRDHPYIPPQRLVVNFKRKDEAQGAAFGFIGITGAPHITIPIIIRARELSPLDVMVVSSKNIPGNGTDMDQGSGDLTDDKVQPLNEQTFNEALDSSDTGELVPHHQVTSSAHTEDGSSLRLPFRGRTVLASVLGATDDQKKKLGEILTKNRGICACFNKTAETIAVVESWLNAPAPRNTIQQKIAAMPIQKAEAQVVTGLPLEQKCAEFEAANIFMSTGEAKTAVRYTAVDICKPAAPRDVLLFEDGTYCDAPEKVATVEDGSDVTAKMARVIEKVSAQSLQTGTIVSFLLDDEKWSYPHKIASIRVQDDNQLVKLTMQDDLSREYPVYLSGIVKKASFNSTEKHWVLPLTTTVLMTSAPSEPPMPLEKVAHWIEQNLPDQLIRSGIQYSLRIQGDDFGIGQCSEAKVAEVLDTWFSNGQALLDMVKGDDETTVLRFVSNLEPSVREVVKTANMYNAYPEVAAKALASIAMPMEMAAKLASMIGDPSSADAVLSAGFLTQDNLAEFVTLTDEFKTTVSKLARLLLAIRMGLPGDESATVVAMKSLQRVLDRLESAVQEVNR